ncbi:hypothetical protein [Tepidibacter aestuarii]|uniref:hypothetical protein n=1 Tax=Tepidibacter aestuarii TaxID=2925782 RepID=UPI0020BE66B3|nr:hypothetical protein [Tepidibacter aestuarii]CAH2214865.1 exported protein of unknown function [Tepidibacter aestuarii]
MKKLLLCSVLSLGLILSVGCSKQEELKDTQESKPATNEVVEESVNKKESKDPYKIAAEQVEMIDKELDTYEKKEVKLPATKEGWEEQTLSLWSKDGNPMKLTATEADDMGKMDGLSSSYFKDGKLIFYKAPFSNHVFENEKMVLWMDENMNVLDIPVQNVNSAERGILEVTKERLNTFN